MRHKVVFLDRDGTLVPDRPGFYLRRPEQLRLYPYAAEALRLLRRAGYRLVVVSNQSGIARGYLDHGALRRIHARLRRELKRRGARLDAIYWCPHGPEEGCPCRKPETLLARRAVRELGLTLKGGAVIGDKKADVDLARALGVASVFLRTGHGRSQRSIHGRAIRPTAEARDLLAAARWLLKNSAAALAIAALARPSAAQPSAASPAAPPALSSATVREPYDLVRGTAAPTPELAAMPWFGEYLEYEVKWGIFTVGTANLQARRIEDFNGTPSVRIVSEAKSNRFCNRFYKVQDLNESWMDARRLVSLGYSKKLREGQFFRDEWVVYDYPRKAWLSKRTDRDGGFEYQSGTIPGEVHDILSSMYFIRTKPLKVGDVITLDVNTRENWPLAIKVLRKARLTVPAGTFSTVIVEPFLRQEGIFVQKGKSLRIWLTDDARRIPVYMAVEVFFGDVSAALLGVKR